MQDVAKVYVATLLLKPDALKKAPLDYVAMEIPNEFIVGYGLDYDGYGRNLSAIYTLQIIIDIDMFNVVIFGAPVPVKERKVN